MIFVTVGTHEQPFNRIVEYMDKWAEEHDEEVIIQTGFSTYEPQNAKWQKLFPFPKMMENISKARIVITHGGPSSFIAPLQKGKIPIVIPRQKAFGEHVNDHQVTFCKMIKERMKNIILIENVDEIGDTIANYEAIVNEMNAGQTSNNDRFIEGFEKNISKLVNG